VTESPFKLQAVSFVAESAADPDGIVDAGTCYEKQLSIFVVDRAVLAAAAAGSAAAEAVTKQSHLYLSAHTA
jgi:hypothetical protein